MKLTAQTFKTLQKGFTLIELLVVIAVIGILATIVLLAVNPAEQLARGRDANRIAAVTQLGRSLQAYYTANGSAYPTQGSSWLNTLTSSGDVKLLPVNPTYGTIVLPTSVCTPASAQGGTQAGYCYKTAASEAIVYQRLESGLYNTTKCTVANTAAYWVFSTANAQAGLVCVAAGATEPSSGLQTFTP